MAGLSMGALPMNWALKNNSRSTFMGEETGRNAARTVIECKESRIGKKPIAVPSNVSVTLEGQNVTVKGPLGELSRMYPNEVKVERDQSGLLKVSKALESRRANQMHGLFRYERRHSFASFIHSDPVCPLNFIADEIVGFLSVPSIPCSVLPIQLQIQSTLTDNMVIGVSKGFEKKLQLIGVGYRANVEGKDLVMNLGFSHPVRMALPDGIKVTVEDSTRISVMGSDKCAVGDFCAAIRKWRTPEPYKGKGIKYADEVIRRKEGKAGKKK